MKGLTRRQVEFLSFLRAHQAEKGFNPSYDEIAAALGIRKGGIARMVNELEARGAIRRIPNRARSLEIVEDAAEHHLRRLIAAIKTGDARAAAAAGIEAERFLGARA